MPRAAPAPRTVHQIESENLAKELKRRETVAKIPKGLMHPKAVAARKKMIAKKKSGGAKAKRANPFAKKK